MKNNIIEGRHCHIVIYDDLETGIEPTKEQKKKALSMYKYSKKIIREQPGARSGIKKW